VSSTIRRAAGIVLGLLTAACATVTPGDLVPSRAPDFRPEQVRRPLVLARLVRAPGQWEAPDGSALLAEYQGTLLELLNARAVLAAEVQVLGERDPRLDPAVAVDRARRLGADHAILVEIRVARVQPAFCLDTRRPLRASATLWSQSLRVLRAHDGAVRLATEPGGALDVLDVEIDCETPRESRRRSLRETAEAAVRRVLGQVVGP